MKKKIFVDTDIIYDLLANRESFYQAAAKLFTLSDEGTIDISISALSMPNLHYLISKQLSNEQAKQIMRKLKLLVNVVPLTEKIIDLALNSEFIDFEDAIQHYSAIEGDCDLLLTRNLKDFKKAQLPVMTAQDFISL
jgi:predicted nucleic acid-binding protein